jgi:NADH:ubiquinone oxidoreductase subunit F (NADH-binding)
VNGDSIFKSYAVTDRTHLLEAYRERGGYTGLHKALTAMQPLEVEQQVKESGLQGRGGAGF